MQPNGRQPADQASKLASEATPAGSVSQQGAHNLLNLANIDNAFFNQQQQQLRAEQMLFGSGTTSGQHSLSARPSGSPSSNTSSECLNYSDRQSCCSGASGSRVSATSANPATTSSSSCSSGGSTANLARPAQLQAQLKQQQTDTGASSRLQQVSSEGTGAASEHLPTSDTTDDIKSLSSQFNILGASGQQTEPIKTMHQPSTGCHDATAVNLEPSTALLHASAPFIQGHGHYFTKKTFHKPTYCHHCTEMLWGLIGQGYICEVCNFVVHERCMKVVISCCSTVASTAIKNPMPHCWVEAHPKKKFCHVCRKRIDESSPAIRCSVCEFCAHAECQEFSISDCRECATYVPDQSVQDVVQHHHWREGNFPPNSRCHACRKSCISTECLSGLRCEWCQITLHTVCVKQAPRECNLGCLQSIMLPPSCVSIPRTDVPMETIIGVQSRFMGSNSVWTYASSAMMNSYNSSVNKPFSGELAGSSSSSIIMAKRDTLTPRATSEDFCPSNLPASAIAASNYNLYYQQQEDMISRDKDEELLRVYDGNSSLKKRSFRLISVHKAISRDNLIAACLRAFYIHDDVNHYALIDITEGTGNERELDEQYPLGYLANVGSFASSGVSVGSCSSSSSTSGSSSTASKRGQTDRSYSSAYSVSNKPAMLLLRYRPPDSFMGSIKVYPGRLNVNSDLTYINVLVTSDTSVIDVIKQALDMFKLRSNDLNRYRLVEVSLDKGSAVHERTMDNQESPWEIIKNVARESVRQKELTRFYLQQQDEVYCSSVAIYVGNLPTNLSQKQYESMLMDHLGKPYRFKQMNPIYYEYGSCIITYDNADIAVKAFYMLRESVVRFGDETRNLVVLLLPNIVPEMIPDGVRVS